MAAVKDDYYSMCTQRFTRSSVIHINWPSMSHTGTSSEGELAERTI